jgi:hypothetical protein
MTDFADDPRRGCAPGKVNPDDFFADSAAGMARAKNTCASCPFKHPCLQRALHRQEKDGIWGGVNLAAAGERRAAVARHQEFRVMTGWQRKLSDADIALQMGLHPASVQKIRTELGLPAHYGPGGRPVQRQEAA